MKIFTRAEYGSHYNQQKLFDKLQKIPGRILALLLVKTFLLYELLKKHDTPLFVKAAIIGVFGYLICPVDAVPDFLPGGYVDDIALMTALFAGIDHLINDDIKRKAEDRAGDFTDEDELDDNDDDDTEEDET